MNENWFVAELNNFLANLTSQPGVYKMLDITNTVLYVGKAANLKKRISSYFKQQNLTAKTRSLVHQIHSIAVCVTRSETEALLLESNLIKTLRPKYNILLRDDKSYPYIHISEHPFYPRIEIYRSKKKPVKGNFYGPYPNTTAVRETINLIEKVFKIRNCRDSNFNGRSRPCLQYQIKRCSAPCSGYIAVTHYQQAIQDASRFLQGKCQLILDELTQRMKIAVEQLAFEEAAVLRDQIKSLRLVQEQQGMAQLQGEADIIAIDAQPGFACVVCSTIRDGEVINSQRFFPVVPQQDSLAFNDQENLWQQVFEAFISFYYVEDPKRIPDLIITHGSLSNALLLATLLGELRGKACSIKISPRGLQGRWLDFSLNNLKIAVSEYRAAASTLKMRYQELAKLLMLENSISRMECFDISHTQGKDTVASCVVFDRSGPCKKEYRRFTIRQVNPGDDCAAIAQAVFRRCSYLLQQQNLPDVLIIDGGKNQVAAAKKVLIELNIHEKMTLVGIAKGPLRKAGLERIILSAVNQEMTLPADSSALHLLQHIRDEAHRFAIKMHRQKRDTAFLHSTLEEVEGVGPKRRQALLSRFGGMRELAKAPCEEIAKVKGISKALAKKIFIHFHPDLI